MKPPADNWDRDEREIVKTFEGDLAAMRARHAGAPPIDLLRAAQAEVLPPDVDALAEEHLSHSAWSRALVAGLADAGAALADEDADRLLARIRTDIRKDGREKRAGAWRAWLPVVATAAVLAIVVVAVAVRRRGPAAPAHSTGPEATVAVNRPPVFQLPLEKPEVRLSVAALTWRGVAGANQLIDDLAPATDAFRRSDYQSAVRVLAPLELRYPTAVEPPFYRGLSLLFLNDPVGAVDELQKADRIADVTLAADVAWYLAVAEQRAGRTADARARLDKLCGTTSPRSAQACDAAGRLDATTR
jgi:hypothetical protein